MKIRISQDWLDNTSYEKEDYLVSAGCSYEISKSLLDKAQFLEAFLRTIHVKEMIRLNWVQGFDAEQLIDSVWSLLKPRSNAELSATMFRGSLNFIQQDLFKQLSTRAWFNHAVDLANDIDICKFDSCSLDKDSITELTQLSSEQSGPKGVNNWMKIRGIKFLIQQNLPGMSLDGATTMLDDGSPMIVITLRYDRLDYFWFTLLHEIGHIVKHILTNPKEIFLDDLEEDSKLLDEKEAEANSFARDSFIPRDIWKRSKAKRFCTEKAIIELSEELKIHPSIVAGRLRYESNDYTIFSRFIHDPSLSLRELLFEDL